MEQRTFQNNKQLLSSESYKHEPIFFVGWWNGGGSMRKSIRFNKVLLNFLSKKPDIFVYGEAGTPTKRGLLLPGYSLILHKAKIEDKSSYRRGLAILYLEKYKHIISRARASVKFDIFWIKIDCPNLPVFLCFFMHQVVITQNRYATNFIWNFRRDLVNSAVLEMFSF